MSTLTERLKRALELSDISDVENDFARGMKFRNKALDPIHAALIDVSSAATSVWNLEHVNRTTHSPTALAHYNQAIAELGDALKRLDAAMEAK